MAFPRVGKGAQTLTGFEYSPDYALFNQTPPTVTAPTGAKTPLSYSAAPAEVCTVDAVTGALTFTGLGSCEITVTAAVTANYEAATAGPFEVKVDTAGMLVLNLAAVAGDNVVNIAEKAAGFSVTGDAGSRVVDDGDGEAGERDADGDLGAPAGRGRRRFRPGRATSPGPASG